MKSCIYFDNAATTKPFDIVCTMVSNTMQNQFGNPSSLHGKGLEAERIVADTRKKIAKTLSVKDSSIIFMASGTEINNFSIFGAAKQNMRSGKHIITTKTEHASIVKPITVLQNQGWQIDFIDVDSYGMINLDMLEEKIRDDTVLIAFTHVNNENGMILPLEQIGKIKNQRNPRTILLVDSVQSYGKLIVTPQKCGVDILTLSAHKIHGPKGVAAMYLDSRIKILPLLFGGGQEYGLRPGTENVPGIAGFGVAAEKMHLEKSENYKKVTAIKEKFISVLRSSELEFRLISKEKETSPYILTVAFANIKAEVLLHHLSQKQIYVSSGSACSSNAKNSKSHVLTAMGIEPQWIEGVIRFSFSASNTAAEVDEAMEALLEIVPRIAYKL